MPKLHSTLSVLPWRAPAVPARQWLEFAEAWLRLAQARRRERQLLSELDSRMLRDIGLSPFEAAREARKPWWQP